jgi:hypothetical protein
MTSEFHWTPNASIASARSLLAGSDLCCGDEYTALPDAITLGLVDESDLDKVKCRCVTDRKSTLPAVCLVLFNPFLHYRSSLLTSFPLIDRLSFECFVHDFVSVSSIHRRTSRGQT